MHTSGVNPFDRTTGTPIQIETRGYDALNRVITDTVDPIVDTAMPTGATDGESSGLIPPQFSRKCATLLADNPDLTAILRFLCKHVDLPLDVVDTAEALLDAKHVTNPTPGDFVIVDCTALATAFTRAAAFITQMPLDTYVVHSRQEFVDDLKLLARGRLIWLPPQDVGLVLLDKLRVLTSSPPAIVSALGSTPEEPAGVLTCREQDVLSLVAAGNSYKQIAARLDIGLSTVKAHVAHIKAKWKVSTRTDLIADYLRLNDGR